MISLKLPMLLASLLLYACVFAQTQTESEAKKVDIGIDGMLGLSIGEKTVGINVGGPSLKFKVGDFKIGVGAFPSLFIRDDKAVPRLAVSPIVEYKKWMLIAPYYGYTADNSKQIWTFGIGYRFMKL
ncbi:hypothetical protein [Flavobacterium silvaticum]|uniref:Outer membrane protein beta-barrel domain-containing protein n=1 Tax=Flavobacterium silvaticum TaxID=1852020 RepID=A0A972FSJ6_9FLAO|nr:hypothetical protein [Flavobacterium silvaticum]NMH28579.1 hypothetical protein [Flavobacterium silvaticum]